MWLKFLLSAAVLVAAATQLAKYGDVIALRTRWSGMFIGLVLLAAATSLPELFTSISSINQNTPDLAAGNLLGSNTVNMFLLAVIDLMHRKQRILRKAAMKHALTGSLAVFLIGLVVFFILADIRLQIGWVGVDSLVLIGAYLIAVRLIQSNTARESHVFEPEEIPEGTPRLWVGVLGFLIAAIVLAVDAPIMTGSSAEIAQATGLGTTFIGSTLVAAVTSMPELVTSLAAVRIGLYDMAIGNLFGSVMFNVLAFGLTDVFYTRGRFLAAISPSFILVAVLGLLMTGLGLIGNVANLERRIWFIELDALALILLFFGGMWLLYLRG
jgi:cation:H+ antiporter